MAYENLGRTFMPQFDGGESTQGGARLEDVLRILSFRLPRILGAKPIAPGELLRSPGSGGDPLAEAMVSGVLGGHSPTADPWSDPGAPSPFARLLEQVVGHAGRAPSPGQLGPVPKPRIDFEPTPGDGRVEPTVPSVPRPVGVRRPFRTY